MKKKLVIIFICSFLFVLGILPYIWASMYTLPGIDDISVALEIRETEGGFFTKIISHAFDMYFNWEGRYFSNVLMSLIRPYDLFGIEGLRFYTMCIVFLFSFSIIYILYILLKSIFEEETIEKAIIFGLLLLFMVFNVNTTVEFFYYNIVIHVYTFPFILGGLSLAYMVECYAKSKYQKRFAVNLIIGGVAVGATQQISAIICYVALLLTVKSYIRSKKFISKECVYFCVVFIGSCINAFAPGNFVRAGNSSVLSVLSLARALYNSFYITILELRHIVVETYFPFYAVLFYVLMHFLCIHHNDRIRMKTGYVVLHTIIVSAIGLFPVVLGHGSTYTDNRNITILDFEIIFGLLLAIYAYYNNSLSSNLFKNVGQNNKMLVIIVIFGMICFNQKYDFTDQPSLSALHQLNNGLVQQYSEDVDVVLNYLEKASGEVQVPRVHCEQGVINKLDFQEDSNYWVNEKAAEYYGVDKIALNINLEVNDLRRMGY